jgi:methionine synthase I (cobalamin-dependent)
VSSFASRLEAGPVLLLDGGLGTLLMARGLPAGLPPELWNVERPEQVTAAHRAYVEAGSEAVHTNSFGASPVRLAHFGLAERCEELNAAAVRAARAAGPAFVIGDIGPTGEYLPPVGQGDPAAWRAGFLRQASALVAAGVDALHLETMSDLREALIALEAARAVAGSLPVLASQTFERKRRGFFTVMGNPLLDSLRALREAGAAAVGANCSIASEAMAELAREASPAVGPLVVQPNAGQPRTTAQGLRYDQQPWEFAADLFPLAGTVGALGGCCGTDPRFIAALSGRLGRA